MTGERLCIPVGHEEDPLGRISGYELLIAEGGLVFSMRVASLPRSVKKGETPPLIVTPELLNRSDSLDAICAYLENQPLDFLRPYLVPENLPGETGS